ncbi:hypothetical protein HDE_05307 [Halotydeus destructor]|nr:hypothetical protein HDE_05307 [Halotydeus destructor]
MTTLVPGVIGYFVLLNHGGDGIKHMAQLFDDMPSQMQESCSMFDNFILIAVIAYSIYCSTMYYIFYSSSAISWLEQVVPITFKLQSSFYYLFSFFRLYAFLSTVVGNALYVSVQYTFLKYGQHVLNLGLLTKKRMSVIELNRQELTNLRRMYSLFNEKRLITNTKLGVLPFIWLSSLFVTLTAGITDVVIHPQLYASPLTLPLMALGLAINMMIIFAVIVISSMATETFEQAKTVLFQITQRLSNQPLSSPIKIACRSLLIDIIIQPVVPAMVWDMFAANKQLILQFAGSVVPFSVMMITTVIQQKQADCPVNGVA